MKITFYASTNEVLSELGRRIKSARIALPATQKEMAEMTNLSQKTISNLETGKDVSFSTVVEVLEQGPRPSEIAALGKPRERAGRKAKEKPEAQSGWKWGDEE